MRCGPRVQPATAAGEAGSEDLVCYCFRYRREDLEAEAAAGDDRIYSAICDQVRAGACACGIHNPSGKCCLPEVRAIIGRSRQRE